MTVNGTEHERILEALCHAGADGLTTEEIADRAGVEKTPVESVIRDFRDTGAVTRVGPGRYDLTGIGALVAGVVRSRDTATEGDSR